MGFQTISPITEELHKEVCQYNSHPTRLSQGLAYGIGIPIKRIPLFQVIKMVSSGRMANAYKDDADAKPYHQFRVYR